MGKPAWIKNRRTGQWDLFSGRREGGRLEVLCSVSAQILALPRREVSRFWGEFLRRLPDEKVCAALKAPWIAPTGQGGEMGLKENVIAELERVLGKPNEVGRFHGMRVISSEWMPEDTILISSADARNLKGQIAADRLALIVNIAPPQKDSDGEDLAG